MRSISSTLEAAQKAASGTPYIHLVFYGASTYDYSSDQEGRRILLIDHTEEPYDDFATIILRNNDRTIPDLLGYYACIGYGHVTGSGNEYSTTAELWVKHQQTVSAGGRLYEVLELEGMWTKLREALMLLGSPPYYSKVYTTDTVYAIIDAVLAECGISLAALAEDDGIMGSYNPVFTINEVPFEDAATIIYRLIMMTFSYLRGKVGLEMEVKYPQESDAVDINYYSDAPFYFYEYRQRNNLLIPNHVYVFANAGTDELWTNVIVAEAKNQAEIDKYADVPVISIAATVTDQTEAENRAAALLVRVEAEDTAGRLIAPHDCRLELYDRIKIWDDR